MQEYKIYTYAKMPEDWADVPRALIDQYAWSKEYMPLAYGQLIMIPSFGFVLRMTCKETNPRAVYEEHNQPVYTDSCLEFFAIFDHESGRYINMEMNAKGTLLSFCGVGRENRTPLINLTGGKLPTVTPFATDEEWGVVAEIPFSILDAVYGIRAEQFVPGYAFRGNFYKCGDETAVAHYGSWSRVGTKNPDFHRPEYFGALIID